MYAGVTKGIRIRGIVQLVRGPLVTPVHLLSKYKREFKLQVYRKEQTSDSSWETEFLKIENEQTKTDENNSYG